MPHEGFNSQDSQSPVNNTANDSILHGSRGSSPIGRVTQQQQATAFNDASNGLTALELQPGLDSNNAVAGAPMTGGSHGFGTFLSNTSLQHERSSQALIQGYRGNTSDYTSSENMHQQYFPSSFCGSDPGRAALSAPCGKIAETLSACRAGAHFSIFGDGTSKFD